MKSNKALIIALIIPLFLISVSCGSDDPSGPTPQDIAFELLAGQWSFGQNGGIILDGQDESLNYPNFSLSFADGTYQTINGGDLFRASGTWEWSDEMAGGITMDTGEEVTILNLSLTNLRFSFDHTGSGGVVAGTSGNYMVTLNK